MQYSKDLAPPRKERRPDIERASMFCQNSQADAKLFGGYTAQFLGNDEL